MPRRGRIAGVREIEAFHLTAIRSAKTLIYLENQYFTCAQMANALADRLLEDDGPEVVLITTLHSPSWFDRMTMDDTSLYFMQQLTAADRHNRFHAYSPRTAEGAFIVVHAKATLIDDRLLRIGSANFNNRSMGFDKRPIAGHQARHKHSPASARVDVGVDRFRRAHDRNRRGRPS